MIVAVSNFLPFQILTQWGRKRVFLSPNSWRNLLSSHWLVLGHMSIIEPVMWPRGWGRRVGLGESGCTVDPRLGHLTHSRQPGLYYGSLSVASRWEWTEATQKKPTDWFLVNSLQRRCFFTPLPVPLNFSFFLEEYTYSENKGKANK